MTKVARRHTVAGSERTPPPGARMIGPADPHERALVTILLRRRSTSPGVSSFVQEQSLQSPSKRQHLTHQEYERVHSASDEDIDKIEQFAAAHGLDVAEVHPDQRRIVLSGTVAALSTAFGVHLAEYEHAKGRFRGRSGEVTVPEEIAPLIEGVFGLDNRPQASPHFRLQRQPEGNIVAHGVTRSFTPPQVAQLYNFPAGMTGQGQTIAVVELGGGFLARDLTQYFKSLGLTKPVVKSISVNGGRNAPTGDANGPDGEVMLDIEVAGAVAPGARIVVYFAPNTDAGFLGAIKSAIHDKRNSPSVISISWGAAESNWTAQAMTAMDDAFQDAAALGITVCCASGDNGSSDGERDGLQHVDFPASSPFALACGGTHLEGTGSSIGSEVAWNDTSGGATGGGVSDMFDMPAWQASANIPHSANHDHRKGRGVPDVSGDADPATGYQVLVDGQRFVIGGTSAVAPLWAALIALINQKRGKPIGYLNPVVYGAASGNGAFRDILKGENGAYGAHAGWDACTGLGTPNGAQLMKHLS